MAQFTTAPTTIAEFQSYLGYTAGAHDGYFVVPLPNAGTVYPSDEYIDVFAWLKGLSATATTTFVASGVAGQSHLTATVAQTISAGVAISGITGIVGNTVVPTAVTASTTIPLNTALTDTVTNETFTLHNDALTGADFDLASTTAIFIANAVNFAAGVTTAGGTQLLV